MSEAPEECPDVTDPDTCLPGHLLQQAATFDNTELMERLLDSEEKLHVNSHDIHGRSPLYTAVHNNSLECVGMLLNAGADPNLVCGEQCGDMTALHRAALDNKHKMVGLLLSAGADVNREDASGETPLTLALANRSEASLTTIREHIRSRGQEMDRVEKEFLEACRQGNAEKAKDLSEQLPTEQLVSAINYVPDSQISLLHRACSEGWGELVELLLVNGAEVHVHPVTGHSPLHATCQSGSLTCATSILQRFPELIRAPTIEGIFPLHLACAEGHVDLVKLFLNYDYPNAVKKLYKQLNGDKMYRLGLAVNAKDGHGRTPLHTAVINRCENTVAALLSFTVSLDRHFSDKDKDSKSSSEESGKHGKAAEKSTSEEKFCPVELDIRDLDGNTPLHLAIKGDGMMGYHTIARLLLESKANPNRPIISSSGNSTPLYEACRLGDSKMVDLLMLKHRARDETGLVLMCAIAMNHEAIIGTLLQGKSHVDSEHRVNHVAVNDGHKKLGNERVLLASIRSRWPNTAVAVNWHQLGLQYITMSWLRKCSRQQIGRPPSSAKHGQKVLSLCAITRLDLSNNSLQYLPSEVLKLPSLYVLNVASNQLQGIRPESTAPSRNSKVFEHQQDPLSNDSGGTVWEPSQEEPFDCPLLEEINFQDNQFQTLPAALFSLESLRKLNCSHNKLTSMPYQMWSSPALTELNLSHNQLKTLPYGLPDSSITGEADDETSSGGASSVCSTPRDSTLLESDQQPEPSPKDTPNSTDLPMVFHNHWQRRVPVRPIGVADTNSTSSDAPGMLQELNLAHNLFESAPVGLACMSPQLEKLIMSSNKMTQVGSVDNYPVGLRMLDLSHNNIVSERLFDFNTDDKICYNPSAHGKKLGSGRGRCARSSTASLQSLVSCATSTPSVCPHRSHTALTKLRMLYLAHNKLTRLSFRVPAQSTQELELSGGHGAKSSPPPSPFPSQDLLYPNLAVLDVSFNQLTSLPPDISLLTNLMEFKVTANKQLKELPADLGLLKKLWNLNVEECAVERTLLALLGGKARKTAAILSYLKSIKEEATLYNHMKLMFVGVQGIGKTSLLALLRKEGKSTPCKLKTWAQRKGEEGASSQDVRGENLSTVGVDIADLHLEKNGKKIIFSTWDFGGQREYYATHQYFLSKRSLYLVVWKVTDGEKGVQELLQWLVNIQARAPNSPVIIVGTHLDKMRKKSAMTNLNDLQCLIQERYMRVAEPEKHGLPRVLAHVEVSCRSMFNTRMTELVNIIWKVVSEEPLPGSRGARLLEQKVPACYVRLQEVVGQLAEERKQQGNDPVLYAPQYKRLVTEKMEAMYKCGFHDSCELNQATQFLHDNGVLLHYDDVNLQDVYFLDPQWLCDMLASVVTIREINSLARAGIMRTDDLKVLFKNTAFRPDDIKTYIINLLNKFELALMWDNKNLLIPSLLPSEKDRRAKLPGSDVRVPVQQYGQVSFPMPFQDQLMSRSLAANDLNSTLTMPLTGEMELEDSWSGDNDPFITGNKNPAMALVRLYIMSYFPSGFWPRLITRLLGDEGFYKLVHGLYTLPGSIGRLGRPEWQCWQTGVELTYLGVSVLSVKEVIEGCGDAWKRRQLMVLSEQESQWSPLDLQTLSILELLIPNQALTVQFPFAQHSPTASPNHGFEGVVYQPNSQNVAALLARTVDHLDTLLEDWYPDLGSRFVQNARGMYLITRLVPCPRCLLNQPQSTSDNNEDWMMVDVNAEDGDATVSKPVEIPQTASGKRAQSLPTCLGDAIDTIKTLESAPNSDQMEKFVKKVYCEGKDILETVEGIVYETQGESPDSHISDQGPAMVDTKVTKPIVYCHLLEQCFQAAQMNRVVACPLHGNLGPYFIGNIHGIIQSAHIAPDAVFQDIGNQYLVGQDAVTRGKFLGKGAFGAVYAGRMMSKTCGDEVPVAIKMLQPVKPIGDYPASLLSHYQQEKQRWDRDPLKHCCEAYLNARKELAILLALKHPHIVPLLALSLHPLCLVLSLAPLGALNEHLREVARMGARLPPLCVATIIAQVASALSYLHTCQIIYRDLKSENVLVWSVQHGYTPALPNSVKLADYGVSRCVMPAGTKGLAGTPPFIAPEIIQHNGEEPYTEKVDCFSFGMFMYELLALKMPFDGLGTQAAAVGGANMKGYILGGGRPLISAQELMYPTHMLDLMGLCWSHDPTERPSAAEILDLACSREFSQLLYTQPLAEGVEVTAVCSSQPQLLLDDEMESDGEAVCDVWLAVTDHSTDLTALQVYTHSQHQCLRATKVETGDAVVTCMCVTGSHVWCVDERATVVLYSVQDYREVLRFPATSRPQLHVSCITYDRQDRLVYLVLDNGSFVLCSSEVPSDGVVHSLVKKTCNGNGHLIHCISVLHPRNRCSELWCGQQSGRISIWDMQHASLSRVSHSNSTDSQPCDVISMVTSQEDPDSVWSYAFPGSKVYRWDAVSRKKAAFVDVSSLFSALTGHALKDNKTQVSTMNVHQRELFIATTWGYLVVVDKVSMTHITKVHIHASDAPYVSAILSLAYPTEDEPGPVPTTLVTVGRGYRDVVMRQKTVKRHSGMTVEKPDSKLMYMLTWRGEGWREKVYVETKTD